MPIELIIFDLDGTLIDTSRDLTNSLNAALAPHGLGTLTPAETKAIVGEGVRNLIKKVLAPSGKQDIYDETLDAFLAHYERHVADLSAPYPGVEQTLNGPLAEYRKAVLTNKRTDLSIRLMDALGLSGHFELISGPDSVPAQKPDPAGLLYVIEKLGATRNEAVMVGDSGFDIDTGKAAGIPVIAVTYGFRPRESLTDANILIDNFSELPDAIKSLG